MKGKTVQNIKFQSVFLEGEQLVEIYSAGRDFVLKYLFELFQI